MKLTQDAKLLAAVLLVGAAGLWWITRKGVAQSLATSAVQAAEGAAVGTVVGIGKAVGIPETSKTQCQKDLAAGKWWDASFSCPASTFIGAGAGAVFGSTALTDAQAADARNTFAATDPRRTDL